MFGSNDSHISLCSYEYLALPFSELFFVCLISESQSTTGCNTGGDKFET